ncbi:hypothetical protein [Microbispora catharanthi]|uniref:Uncharacterized protein n=1 Tax=Microbispora catharanthi TaxID=1712871 RepID=A0A5N6BIV7_9ACTN|nr:hypothetical protein [Microbispora catharanthi]KAB8180382.1 hypothetical protein FH610_032835 [Microbispora catharanthi]
MVRLAGALLAVVLLLSGSAGLRGRPTFGENATWAVSTWRTSGAAKIWRTGFVPFEDLSTMSRKTRERINHEYGWVVAGPLPAPPAEGRIRWDDGSTMRVPVIRPREALMALSAWPEEYTFPDDEEYKLTGATFTTMRLRTSRGMATLPAWRLYFSNLPGPIDHVAVDQKAVGTIEDAVGDYSLADEQITDFEVLDERTLLVGYDYGRCTSEPLPVSVRVREEPDVVVLGIDLPYEAPGPCAGVGGFGKGLIRLDKPLGDRVVVDAISALPVLCRRARNTCRAGRG